MRAGTQECLGEEQFRVCRLNRDTDCLEWSIPVACALGERCVDNRCAPAIQDPCDAPLVGRMGVQRGLAQGESIAAGTCGGRGSEQVIAFTAEAAGTYTFDTDGSNFQTILHGRLACKLPNTEIGCDNTSPGRLTTNLNAGQTIYLFVDGDGDGGQYVLNVSQPMACADECVPNDLSCADDVNIQRCADFDGDGCTG